jgi:hypothetical protein
MPSLTTILVTLMATQATLGLLIPTVYRDPEWIKATWFGNDWITLLLAAPLLLTTQRMTRAGSIRGELLCIGGTGYAVYNYAFYLFGAALNAFLPLYVIILGVGILTLASALSHVDPTAVARCVRTNLPARLLGAYLVFVGCGLAVVWIGMWGAYVFAGRPTPVQPEAFKVVAALDLLWLVPSLAAGGALLWNRRPWGFVIAAAASVQGTVYLLVLSVNSFIAIHRRLAESPGELPIWGPLTILTWATALLLINNVTAPEPSGGKH